MFKYSYTQIYNVPSDYAPPEDSDLCSNVEYPNLNSRDYAKRSLNRTPRMHKAWECVDWEDGVLLVGNNKSSGRGWTGSLWGFEYSADDRLSAEQAAFKLQCNAYISGLRFLSSQIVIVALHSGRVQVWSTHSAVRNPSNPYCLFLIGEKCEHVAPITCLEVMKSNRNKSATGSKDGTLKLWDTGSADLLSTHTFRFAHTDSVTGISSLNTDDSILATCSLDKSAFLWDIRIPRPAAALYENHSERFKALSWSCLIQGAEQHSLLLGDEGGYVHAVDKRSPNRIVDSMQYFDRSIRKILPCSERLAIIGDTNIVKIATTGNEVIYENSDSQHMVRDGVWYNSEEFLSVGFEGKLHVHKVIQGRDN